MLIGMFLILTATCDVPPSKKTPLTTPCNWGIDIFVIHRFGNGAPTHIIFSFFFSFFFYVWVSARCCYNLLIGDLRSFSIHVDQSPYDILLHEKNTDFVGVFSANTLCYFLRFCIACSLCSGVNDLGAEIVIRFFGTINAEAVSSVNLILNSSGCFLQRPDNLFFIALLCVNTSASVSASLNVIIVSISNLLNLIPIPFPVS